MLQYCLLVLQFTHDDTESFTDDRRQHALSTIIEVDTPASARPTRDVPKPSTSASKPPSDLQIIQEIMAKPKGMVN